MKYLAITAILCLILAGASFAGNVTITEVLTGGDLTLTMPDNFSLSGVTLGTGSSQNATACVEYIAEDSRGTGAGWNVGFQISQFMTAGTPARTISTSKFVMSLVYGSIFVTYGQAADYTNGPQSLIASNTNVAGNQVEVIHALADYGMGKYRFQPQHTLTVDADRYAGTYTATLTATLNNVP